MFKITTVTDRHADAIDYAVNILIKEPFCTYIEKIYLFGSCARGTCKYTSDIDLLIQCNKKFSPSIARQMRIATMPDKLNMPEVDLKFVKESNWQTQRDQFSQNLSKEGILLWKKK